MFFHLSPSSALLLVSMSQMEQGEAVSVSVLTHRDRSGKHASVAACASGGTQRRRTAQHAQPTCYRITDIDLDVVVETIEGRLVVTDHASFLLNIGEFGASR